MAGGIMGLGPRLRERRRALGLTQEDAAALFGVEQSGYGKWETGVNKPGDEHLAALARFLDTTVADVLLARHAEFIEQGLLAVPDPDQLAARLERIEAALEAEGIELPDPPAPPPAPQDGPATQRSSGGPARKPRKGSHGT